MSEYFSLPPSWRSIFEELGNSKDGLSFEIALQAILYHPTKGYYTSLKRRVGKGGETDFYTAHTLGPLWGRLVLASIIQFIGEELVESWGLWEMGAERGSPTFSDVCPFSDYQVVSLGDNWPRSKSQCILFSNELLDAQPFRQYRFSRGCWQEWGLFWNDKGLFEGPLKMICAKSEGYAKRLPCNDIPEGHIFDFPTHAESLLERICQLPSTKALVFFDYGRFLESLLEDTPQGTARAYYRHKQINSLWSNLGDQDITHHVVWDFLIDVLKRNGFQSPEVMRQEAFFMKYANDFIAKIIAENPTKLTAEKQALQALLSPAHFGSKFQVLFAKK